MAIKSLRILLRLTFPGKTIRLWDGAGPVIDGNGDVWSGCTIGDGLDTIESAINGEASSLTLGLSGVDSRITELAYTDLVAGNVIGSRVEILIQPCDEFDQPDGDPEVRFTGTIDNMPIEDVVAEDGVVSTIAIEVVNRFDLRTLTSGASLSDIDQKARSAQLNPGGNPDRFAERIPLLQDHTLHWPVVT